MFGRRPHIQAEEAPAQLQPLEPPEDSAAAIRLASDDDFDEPTAQDDGFDEAITPQIRQLVRERLMRRIEPSVAVKMRRDRLRARIGAVVAEIANEERLQLNGREQERLADEMLDDMVGVGPIEPLLADDEVTDILVNGPNQVYVERKGQLELTNVTFRDNAHVLHVAQRIAASVGRRIDESSPMLDARLADGSRVNAIANPCAIDGVSMSIRKFPKRRAQFGDMVRSGNLSPNVARVLEIAAACRLNILVSGGTGAGKTTLLNAMSRLISPKERIVTIEDAAELQLQQPHVVRLETRPANAEGTGLIGQGDLLKNALRMRPDRIIHGECRGAEAFDMLQAMNTGHDGSMSTLHSNSPRDALIRLENMLLMGAVNMPLLAIRRQIAGAVHLIVQIARMRDGMRRIQS
ncbi:MAG: CpaF family protein, partial [Alphaproteobacteria bacterium]